MSVTNAIILYCVSYYLYVLNSLNEVISKLRILLKCNVLIILQVRAPQGAEPKIRAFDADHERKRKSQLIKLFNRTTEQVGLHEADMAK